MSWAKRRAYFAKTSVAWVGAVVSFTAQTVWAEGAGPHLTAQEIIDLHGASQRVLELTYARSYFNGEPDDPPLENPIVTLQFAEDYAASLTLDEPGSSAILDLRHERWISVGPPSFLNMSLYGLASFRLYEIQNRRFLDRTMALVGMDDAFPPLWQETELKVGMGQGYAFEEVQATVQRKSLAFEHDGRAIATVELGGRTPEAFQRAFGAGMFEFVDAHPLITAEIAKSGRIPKKMRVLNDLAFPVTPDSLEYTSHERWVEWRLVSSETVERAFPLPASSTASPIYGPFAEQHPEAVARVLSAVRAPLPDALTPQAYDDRMGLALSESDPLRALLVAVESSYVHPAHFGCREPADPNCAILFEAYRTAVNTSPEAMLFFRASQAESKDQGREGLRILEQLDPTLENEASELAYILEVLRALLMMDEMGQIQKLVENARRSGAEVDEGVVQARLERMGELEIGVRSSFAKALKANPYLVTALKDLGDFENLGEYDQTIGWQYFDIARAMPHFQTNRLFDFVERREARLAAYFPALFPSED